MSSIAFEQAMAAYEAVDAALDTADAHCQRTTVTAERAQLLEHRESWRRRLPAGEHALLTELAYVPVQEIGGRAAHVLADRLRIYRRDAKRRIEEAVDLGPRRALTGEPLPPKFEATAAGQRAGLIGGEHVAIIRGFSPSCPVGRRADPGGGRMKLAEVAAAYRPDELRRFADW